MNEVTLILLNLFVFGMLIGVAISARKERRKLEKQWKIYKEWAENEFRERWEKK